MERFTGSCFLPRLISLNVFGQNQFAYRVAHGARDALLFLVCSWLQILADGGRIGLYCSDVSGAFDRVSASYLIDKLRRLPIHPRILQVLDSWLQERHTSVVVGGKHSQSFIMTDMVFQGTVWGPPLWNIFFADGALVIQAAGFTEIIYADDLNAFKRYSLDIDDNTISNELHTLQSELHTWGASNQITFDASKESFHIISRSRPLGLDFRMLGIEFDCKLLMHSCIHECARLGGLRLYTLLRSRRFYSERQLINI